MKRRETVAAAAGGRRPFTRAELAQIRRLTAQHPTAADLDRLREIHAAAGRRRLTRIWEMDYAWQHDAAFAFTEETEDIDPDWSPPWSGPKAR